jgi:2'-phosphotransferase
MDRKNALKNVGENRSKRRSNHSRPSSNSNGSLNELSRTLSWVLRHKAIDLGLNMTTDGYVQVQELLNCKHPRLKGKWTIQQIQEVVETNDKQRYKLEMKPMSNFQLITVNYEAQQAEEESLTLCIRANQGHSISIVDANLLFRHLTLDEVNLIPMVVHGTTTEAWEEHIRKKGLSRMSRTHIHFAQGLPKDGNVISGMRQSCEVLVYIDTQKAFQDNIKFYQSENGVILSAGRNEGGIIPPEYFSKVTDASGHLLN